ncbi:MAG: hypothetical protein OEU36_18790 [Gammaproteobacteria bacterium]|nr:hypothetical protein [Gammaproteobacteria bacterium]
MNRHMRVFPTSGIAVAALTLGAAVPVSWAQEPFGELSALIEINATDGDAGFHVLLDGDAWQRVTIADPGGKKIFNERANRSLREQGLTENFFESAEPPCDPAEEDAVPLAEFLDRFETGEYHFSARTIEGGKLKGETTLTHSLPAAPDISAFDGSSNVDPDNTVITWAAGTDLGGCQDDDLVTNGIIPDPGTVDVVRWEVVVEPNVEILVGPKRVFSVQLPPAETSVTVPSEFLNSYSADGITEFKFEVGAKEASDNQTFSEGTFEINGL